MQTWQQQIPGCFAGMTAPFSMHPNDEKRALEMLEEMQAQGVTWSEAEAEIRAYLTKEKVTSDEMTNRCCAPKKSCVRGWMTEGQNAKI